MRLFASFTMMFTILFVTGCSDSKHFISDKTERAVVQKDFDERRKEIGNDSLFTIFGTSLSQQEKEALTFLYAYMPLGDITDYSGQYFKENVEYSLRAKEEMPWGKIIPEREFRHFVLPIRINNENLDESRKVFYEELKDRVKNLSLHDAVLEVNHWCHEKVVYTPSDSRTSSPLASVKTAYGRCGEESTFTVAALRSVGIPARQVYTPRWAHTDDNHAWVEAWVDGKWNFLGACEPEPVLNLGWFNAPAARGMLMHTKVFGRYTGPEEIMYTNPRYTEINVTDNYAPVAKAEIEIKDAEGNVVKDAKVEFKIYNYAEFYTVATKNSDDAGKVSLTAGKGDMLVWATKNGKFGYGKVSFGKDNTLTVVLDKSADAAITELFDIVPPVEGVKLPEVTPEERALNNKRMAQEDSIRNAYTSTFVNEEKALLFAKENGYDSSLITKLLIASRGNYGVLEEFLSSLKDSDDKKKGIDLLQNISAKDLRDVSLEVLKDNMNGSKDENVKFVLTPRVSNEMLTPYKSFFNDVIESDKKKEYKDNPALLVKFVKDNVTVSDECNTGGSPISPAGVWKSRKADKHSRDIFFVSLARSLEIPARIDEVTGKVQLMKDNKPEDVLFESVQDAESTPQGILKASYTPIKSLKDPKYYSHFTISKIKDNGQLQLLNYDEGDIDMGAGATWSNLLKNGTSLDAGNYVLVTGTRLANGGVLSDMTFFTIEPSKTTNVVLEMRESKDEVQVIGNFNSESMFLPVNTKEEVSVLSRTGRGYYILAVLGVGQEPTNHALRDIAQLNVQFNEWGRKIILLFPNEEQYKKFNPNEFKGLPSTIEYGIDVDGKIQKQIADNMKLSNKTILPMFIIADTFNRVVFVSQGYTIGLGEQMMKIIHKL